MSAHVGSMETLKVLLNVRLPGRGTQKTSMHILRSAIWNRSGSLREAGYAPAAPTSSGAWRLHDLQASRPS